MIIRNGNIHIGNGKVLKDYDILIDKGIIERIDKNIMDENKEIIDAGGKQVFPGFIDPVSSFGSMDISFSMKDNNEISNPITPECKIKYSFNHREIELEELYKVGITTIGASPGNSNIIGGQMAAYRTYGKNSNTMLIKELVGMKGSVIKNVKEIYGERKSAPMTRMGIFAELESFLKNRLEFNMEVQSIVEDIVEGKLPLFITANEAMEINGLINLIKEFNINLVIVGGYQAHKCLDNFSGLNISLVIGELIYLTQGRYNETDLYKIGKFEEKGNPVSFTLTGDYSPSGKVKYLWNGIEFYKSGVSRESLTRMMSLNPAKILGIDHILGSIEEGKIADIVIYDNDPIETYNSRVEYTIINGEIVYSREGERC
ncbi:amidohydrolase family protein [Tissierella sp. MSJ-40]|uniref:Amidohydrolase family protein n=1 Tax=Tissierella simiarum TaxID=2841534 RepID=A0ABS6E1E6_9FIRM|nr:amidohydrolase family protein [Tissierella simiarum]MBU5436401.1 amidohydrolase family protein [Tissierella simiarum]